VTGRHLSFPPFPWFGIRADHCALVGVDCRRRRSSGAIGFVGESAFRVPAMVSSAKISYLIPRERPVPEWFRSERTSKVGRVLFESEKWRLQ
jgi:hypothetical protein